MENTTGSPIMLKCEVQYTCVDGDKEPEKPKSAKDLIADFKEDSDESGSEVEVISVIRDISDSEEPPSKKSKKQGDSKKRKYIQKYVKSWEKIPAFKQWLSESVLGNTYFYCKVCKTDNRCGKAELEKHMASRKHMKNAKQPTLKVQVWICESVLYFKLNTSTSIQTLFKDYIQIFIIVK